MATLTYSREVGEKLNLSKDSDLLVALVICARLGTYHERLNAKPYTSLQLVQWVGCKYRNGHVRALKAAYEAGRFNFQCAKATEEEVDK